MKELITSVLTIVVAFLVTQVFQFLNVPLDEGTFNAIVAAIVTLLISLIFAEPANRAFQSFRARFK